MKKQDNDSKTSRILNPDLYVQILVIVIILGSLGYTLKKVIEFESRISKLEAKLESKNNTINLPDPIHEDVKDQDKHIEPARDIINMSNDKGESEIRVSPEFKLTWEGGPEERTLQIFRDRDPLVEEMIMKGNVVNLHEFGRGKYLIKTVWFDGTEQSEELWVVFDN